MPVFVGSCIACEIFMDVMPNCCPANASPPPKWTENASSQKWHKNVPETLFQNPKKQYRIPVYFTSFPPTYSSKFFCATLSHTRQGGRIHRPWAAEKSIGSLRRLLAIPLRLWQQIAHHDAGARVMCILLHCSARIFSLFGGRLASVLRIFAARVQ